MCYWSLSNDNIAIPIGGRRGISYSIVLYCMAYAFPQRFSQHEPFRSTPDHSIDTLSDLTRRSAAGNCGCQRVSKGMVNLLGRGSFSVRMGGRRIQQWTYSWQIDVDGVLVPFSVTDFR